MEFEIKGLDELAQKIQKTIREHRAYNQALLDAGNLLLANAAKITPEVEGRLKASYEKRPFKGQKEWILRRTDNDTIEAGTSVYYAHMVEEGHELVRVRRVLRKGGRVRRSKQTLGHVAGKHYLQKALEETEKQLPEIMENMLRSVGKEAGFDVTG